MLRMKNESCFLANNVELTIFSLTIYANQGLKMAKNLLCSNLVNV